MKYAKQIFIIFLVTMLGELLNFLLPLPVPAGVYGLFILLAALCSGRVKLPDVERFGGFLLEAMPMMFIPAAVGLLEQFSEIRAIFMPLVLIVVVSTVVVMAATGKAAELVIRAKRERETK
ncbi:MAG: CidA/LrgA family protein [Cloacibacillus porcorum]|nr:CidA/LrgA family protein [Cloacibacillus porcorum]